MNQTAIESMKFPVHAEGVCVIIGNDNNWFSVKRTLFLIPLLVLIPVCGVAGRVYTLDRLVDEALKNSIALQSVSRELDQAESKIQEIYAGLFPQITASVDVGHTFAYYLPFVVNTDPGGASVSRAEGGAPDGGILSKRDAVIMQQAMLSDNLFSIPSNSAIASLSLKQPIFLQGKMISSIRIARARQRILLCSYEETRNQVKAETVKRFYGMLLEQKRLTISKEHLTLALEAHRLSTVNFSLGRARELDTLNSLLQLKQAQIDEKKAESERRTSGESLITHCGIAENPADFWVDGEFPEPVFIITINEAVEELHRGNHRIIQLKGKEIIQREQVRLAKADYLPTVFGGATLGRIGRFSELDQVDDIYWGDDQKIFMSLSWTLFSGLSRQHVVRQRIAEQNIALLAQQRTVDSLELATRTSWEQTTMLLERLSEWKTVVTIAEKSHDVAKIAYEAGTGTMFDLQNAQLELNKKRLAFNEALYTYHVAVTDFKKLIGLM
ncbi:MAG: TolC family protein [Chitinispirillaceae bacterium]|nr:TolC family protein [Chitinispirillaceae bacterium]